MSYETITILIFNSILLILLTGQRVFAAIGIADDLYRMFHVWFGGLRGGLAVGTIGLMVVISAMNGLSVVGMAIGATIALPEMLKRGYDKIMITGVVRAPGIPVTLSPKTQFAASPI